MIDLSDQKQSLFEDRLAEQDSAAVAEAVEAAAGAASELHLAADANLTAAVKPAAAAKAAGELSGADNKEKKKKTDKKDKKADKDKKQLLLRLSPQLWEELAAWAEDDFRSINGQIEYLLTECVHQRHKRNSKKI